MARHRAVFRREGAPDVQGFLDDLSLFTTELADLTGSTGTFHPDPAAPESDFVPFGGTLSSLVIDTRRGREAVSEAGAFLHPADSTTYEIKEE